MHRTACGKVIVHAHPFNKNAEKENPLSQHKHNKIDLVNYSTIGFFTISQSSIDLDFKINFELEILSKPCLNIDSNIYFFHVTRGPPVAIS